MNDQDGFDRNELLGFMLIGALFVDQQAQRVIDNQIDLEFRRRLATDPVFAAQHATWRAYDNDVRDRIGKDLTTAGATLWFLAIALIGGWMSWTIAVSAFAMIFGLGKQAPVLVSWVPPLALTAHLWAERIRDHERARLSLTRIERDLVHHHGGSFHVHEGARTGHVHHRLDRPPIPPGVPPSAPGGPSLPEPW